MTALQEASTKALDALRKAMQGNLDFDVALEAFEALRTALAQQGEPVAWTHSCNALCTDGLELWIDHCPHCGKPRTAHAEQWPPGLITDIVLTVTALHKEVDIGWSPDARSHLSRLSTSIEMLAAAPAPAPVAQQREQQPVCHGCGIPAGDVHMSTCKSGKWPSRVSDGDTAAPALVEQRCTYCDGTGDVHSIDGEWRGTCHCAAAPAPQAQEPTAWRTEALKWIRRKAEDQRATNEQNPRHAEAYPSWGERVRNWHWLADELELEQNSTSFGLEPYQEPAPQPVHQGERAELIRRLLAIANTEANEVADALNEAADMLQSAQPVVQPRDLTDEEILSLEKQTPAMNDAGEEWIYFARAVLKKARE